MELLRKVSEFCDRQDRLHIYKTFVRSVIEKSCVVWHSSLTRQNTKNLERVQKVAVKIITEGKFSYKEGLKELKLPTLEQRRENFTHNFAKKCASNPRTKNMFAQKEKKHIMQLRKKTNLQKQKQTHNGILTLLYPT